MDKINTAHNFTDSFEETEIDFSKFYVIAVFTELKSSGAEVEITEVKEFKENIVVSKKETISDTMVNTQPFHIVKIKKNNKEIIFKE